MDAWKRLLLQASNTDTYPGLCTHTNKAVEHSLASLPPCFTLGFFPSFSYNHLLLSIRNHTTVPSRQITMADPNCGHAFDDQLGPDDSISVVFGMKSNCPPQQVRHSSITSVITIMTMRTHTPPKLKFLLLKNPRAGTTLRFRRHSLRSCHICRIQTQIPVV